MRSRALLRPLRPRLDRHPEFAQHVRTAGLARYRPVAVLHHRHAGATDDERGGGADVEGAAVVAAGAARVEYGPGDRHEPDHLFAQNQGRRGDFVGGFALHAKSGEKCRGTGFVHAAGNEIAHRFRHPRRRQILPGEEGRERLGKPHGSGKFQANSRPNRSPAWRNDPGLAIRVSHRPELAFRNGLTPSLSVRLRWPVPDGYAIR